MSTSEAARVRYMRLIVFFDLPVETAADRKNYRVFRKYLVKEGYLMLQESVYSKLVLTDAGAAFEIGKLTKNKPPKGLVQVLRVTEKQFEMMVLIAGEETSHDELDTLEEFVVI